MIRISALEDIETVYGSRGGLRYGEGVSQLEHAVQCAALADADAAASSLVVAALLHDIGHLIAGEADIAAFGVDDHHEAVGARALAGLFGPAIYEPVALHVAAKRYLCYSEPSYFDALSLASQKSLDLQGGAFGAADAADFERRPHWQDAVRLRRIDDTGKARDVPHRAFADFMPLMRMLLDDRDRS